MGTRSARLVSGVTLEEWGLSELLSIHSGLRVSPEISEGLLLRGTLRCWAVGTDAVQVDETFQVEIQVPAAFPARLPRVNETAGRIPRTFHHFDDGALCLGSSTAQRLAMGRVPTLGAFVQQVVVPYLYGFLSFEATGRLPFGELSHGATGLEDDVRRVFAMPANTDALAVLVLAGQHRRVANKRPCPCGSRRRLGRCHRRNVQRLRDRLGRAWFRRDAEQLRVQQDAEVSARRPLAPRWMRR